MVTDDELHYQKGVKLEEKSLFDDAISEYQIATDINPQHLKSHERLGTLYYMKNMQ